MVYLYLDIVIKPSNTFFQFLVGDIGKLIRHLLITLVVSIVKRMLQSSEKVYYFICLIHRKFSLGYKSLHYCDISQYVWQKKKVIEKTEEDCFLAVSIDYINVIYVFKKEIKTFHSNVCHIRFFPFKETIQFLLLVSNNPCFM